MLALLTLASLSDKDDHALRRLQRLQRRPDPVRDRGGRSAGHLVGSWIAYAVGYYGRLDLLERNRLIHISPKRLQWADDWFERYGAATVFFSRMLPIVRTFISLPAGVAKMPFWRFTAYTLAGCIPWALMLALIGRSVGDNWEHWRHPLGYLDYVVLAAIVAGVAYWIVKRRRSVSPAS